MSFEDSGGFDGMWAELAPVGRDPATGGYRRFAWTAADGTLREWFTGEAAARGLDVTTDRAGNLWAWWGDPDAGRAGPWSLGSHLDSVPDGGAFDGPLGVVSALRGAGRRCASAASPRPGRSASPASPTRRAPGSASPAPARGCSPACSTPTAPGPSPTTTASRWPRRWRRPAATPRHLGRDDETLAGSAPSSSCTSSRAARWSTARRPRRRRRRGGDLAARPVAAATSAAGPTTPAPPGSPTATTRCSALAAAVLAARRRRRAPGRAGHRRQGRASGPTGSTRSRRGDGLAGRPRPGRGRRPRRRRRGRRGGARPRRSRSRGRRPPPFDAGPRATGWPRCSAAPPCCPPAPATTPGSSPPPAIPTAMLFVRNPTGVSHSPDEHAGPSRLPGRRRRARRASLDGARVRDRPTGASTPGSDDGPASPACESSSTTAGSPTVAARAGRRLPATSGCPGVVLPGLRQRAHPRLPPGAARAHPRRRRHVLDLARAMYAVAARLDPDSYLALARAIFAEMALAGVTVRRRVPLPAPRPRRQPVRRPERHGRGADRRRPADAGIRLTLLDTCYLAGGLERTGHLPLTGAQTRFADGDADAWAARVAALRRAAAASRIGAAVHSVRAVPRGRSCPSSPRAAAGRPLHVHLSEQPAENEACVAVLRLHPDAAARRPRRCSARARPRCTRPT